MPLLDHFHPPTQDLLAWESLHAAWATHLADALNERWLTQEYLAAEHRHLGPSAEIDVATFARPATPAIPAPPSMGNGAVATMPQAWAVPAATCTIPALFPGCFEVRIFADRGGWLLVGVIELVSPSNKDRAEERRAFAAKCASLLHEGVSVVLIDIVTSRRANLHNEILDQLSGTEAARLPDDVFLYAAAYRPTLRQDRSEIDVWTERCAVGSSLPTMPLRLTGDLFVPVEFEAAYVETCRRRRVL